MIQTHAGGKARRFITSMLDPLRFAALELAQLYRQRWEIELGFREIKQSLQQAARTGDARGLGRISASLDALDSPARRGSAYPH